VNRRQFLRTVLVGAPLMLVAPASLTEAGGSRKPPKPTLDLIFLATQPDQVPRYRSLESVRTRVSLRVHEWSLTDHTIVAFDATHVPYYFTAGSSDYIVRGLPLYKPAADVKAVLARPDCRGIYLHEMLTYLASINSWNWETGLAALDWSWVTTVVNAAAAAGKRVIWSEAAEGWPTLYANASAMSLLQSYPAGVLVPMYAINWEPDVLVDHSETGAIAAATALGEPLGMSHQVWWWLVRSLPIVRSESKAWMQRGYDHGAVVFCIEGDEPYMTWGSDYLGGVEDFVRGF
jgi:hypothetical protein